MKKTGILVIFLVLLGALIIPCSAASAATDSFYILTEAITAWDGTDADRLKSSTSDYNYTYGENKHKGSGPHST